MTRPLISMVMIARDEARNVERCFSSWWDAVDEVVLCDTGSTDRTIEEAVAYAERHGTPHKLKVTRYEWADDFGAARAYADTFATGQWVSWVDLDDEVRGMDQLREAAIDADSEVQGFFVRYRCAADEHGNVLSEMWRARLVRAGVGKWHYPVHETLRIGGGKVINVDPTVCEWLHRGDALVSERNLRILRARNEREPGDPLVVANIGIELLGLGRTADAVAVFREFLALPSDVPEVRARVSRHLGTGLLKLGDVGGAREVALAALNDDPLSADAHLTLAECAHSARDWQRAYDHAERALGLGKPDTMLSVNPSDYVLHPKAIMASSSFALGDLERAIRLADEVLIASRPGLSSMP